ncbi:unnamed protein product [Pedinophyceae sp. YPF-701]|nr:unnamed protein product [Pedinophyceae sp. YPF-701]
MIAGSRAFQIPGRAAATGGRSAGVPRRVFRGVGGEAVRGRSTGARRGAGSPAGTRHTTCAVHASPSAPASASESMPFDSEGGLLPEVDKKDHLTLVVLGASGDLAKKKIFPALFALYVEGVLPKHFDIVGYARSDLSREAFIERISGRLPCRGDEKGLKCRDRIAEFLDHVTYVPGNYDSIEDFQNLDASLQELEKGHTRANRLFYFSLPPSVFLDACKCTARGASSSTGWTRVIVEKPFGRDLKSAQELNRGMKEHLDEEQIYRIDHYLGKELVENLTVLRFSNLVFEPLWSRDFIRNVQITFTEDFGTDGRGGYYDQYGVIRDIIQNHLLQVLALFAMEPPVSLQAEDVRNEKVKTVKSIAEINMDDVVVGQYRGTASAEGKEKGYLDDPTVPAGSLTPTFAAMCLFINNARWDGVPFLIKAGKALNQRRGEIRIQFRHVPGNLYRDIYPETARNNTNELVIEIQPEEAIYMKLNNKIPGLGLRLGTTRLNLQYRAGPDVATPDAYERMILDAINGDKRLFIRDDELEAAWKLFDPMLQQLEQRRVVPEPYPYGSRGPIGSHYLAAKYGARWGDHDA